ncbi:MAG: DUF115 domain-containing protein [Bacteroidia bacterium]|nr:DUF115 domain-containing protein [Bacteroidia bacterium]
MASETTYKNFSKTILQGINTCLSIMKIVIKSKFKNKLPHAASNTCYVLANGPSLKQSLEKHYEKISKSELICVNTFSITNEYRQLKPKYYVMIDPFFWNGKTEVVINTLKAITEKTDWPMYLLVPQAATKSVAFQNIVAKNKNVILTPFNYTVFKGYEKAAFWFYRKNLAMPQSLNVAITALFLSINLGFKEVYLLGADHTWHENLHMSDDNVLHTKVTHFYENDQEIKYIPFLKAGNPNVTQKAHEFFDIWSRTFSAYMILERYSKFHHCKIYNASEVSFIDAFTRKKL